MTLWRFTAKEIRTRPGRATLTVFSIVISVAAIVSVTMATAASRLAYKQMFESLTGKTDLEIVAEGGAAFDEEVIELLHDPRFEDHVKLAVPVIQRGTILYPPERAEKPTKTAAPDDDSIQNTQKVVRVKALAMGIDPELDSQVRDYELVEGKMFDGPKTVVLDSSFARGLGVKVGDEVKLLTGGSRGIKPAELSVVGLLTARASAAVQSGTIYMSIDDAQKLFAKPGMIDAIHIVLKQKADIEATMTNIAELLPTGLNVRVPESRSQRAEENMVQTEQGLRLASALTLILALFIVLNTFLMNVAERRRQFAIMRAIGATKRQVMQLLMGEGLMLGVIGSAIGIVVGIGGAMLLSRAMSNLMQTDLRVSITPLPIILGAAFGIGLSLLATFIPARKAGKLTPLEGMSKVAVEDREHLSYGVIGTACVAVLGSLVVLAACITGRLPVNLSVPAAAVALFACVFLLPPGLKPMSRMVMLVLQPLTGFESRLAQQQLLRRRSRTGLTIGVLFVAIAFGIGLGTTITNNTQDVRNWFRQTVIGDFFVRVMMPDLSSGSATSLPESLGQEIAAIDGVEDVISAKFVSTRIGKQGVTIIVREFREDEPLPLALKSGDFEEVRQQMFDGQVVISTVLAQRYGFKVGEEIALESASGPKKVRIAAETNEYAFGGLALYMEAGVGKRLLGVEGVDAFGVRAAKDKLAEVERKLEALCEEHGLLLQSFASFGRIVDGMMSGVVGSLWALLVLGFVVAAFGIVNTLTMNVLEQTRELGMLRVIAMTRAQVRKTIICQAAVMGFIGLAPGAAIGIIMAYLMNLSTAPVTGHHIQFRLHPVLIVGCAVAAMVMVLLASWVPGERAARIKLSEALQYE